MAKDVEYRIKLADHPDNAGFLSGLEDRVNQFMSRMEREQRRMASLGGDARMSSQAHVSVSQQQAVGIDPSVFSDAGRRGGQAMGQALGQGIAQGSRQGLEILSHSVEEIMQRIRSGVSQATQGMSQDVAREIQQLAESPEASSQMRRMVENAQREARRARDRERGLSVQSDIQAQRDAETAGRAALQTRLEAFRRQRAEEERERQRAAREQQREQRANDRRSQSGERDAVRTVNRNTQNELREARQLTQEYGRATREVQQYGRRAEEQYNKVAEAAERGARSAFEVARGLALMALDPKDAEAVLGVLLKIQSASDLIFGGVGMVRSMAQAYNAWGRATEATAQRQQAMTRAQTQNTVALQQLARVEADIQRRRAAGMQVTRQQRLEYERLTQEVNEQTVALQRLHAEENRRRVGRGRMGGGIGLAVGGLVGGLGGSYLGSGLEQGLTGGDTGIGSLLGGLGGAGLGGGFGARLGGSIGRYGLAAVGGTTGLAYGAAIGGTAFGLAGLGSSSIQAYKHGLGGGADVGSWADRVASAEVRAGAYLAGNDSVNSLFKSAGRNADYGVEPFSRELMRAAGAIAELADSSARLQAQQDAQEKILARFDRQSDFTDVSIRGGTEQVNRDLDYYQRRIAVDEALGNSSALSNAGSLTRSAQSRFDPTLRHDQGVIDRYQQYGDVTDQDYDKALKRQAENKSTILRYAEAEFRLAQQEAETRQRMNEQSIAAARQRLGVVQQERSLFESDDEKLTGMAEKYNRMSLEERQRVKAASEKARAGGELTNEESDILKEYGDPESVQIAREQERERAQRAGFGGEGHGQFYEERQGRAEQRAKRQSQIDAELGAIDDRLVGGAEGKDKKTLEERKRILEREQQQLVEDQAKDARRQGPRQTRADAVFGDMENRIEMEIAAKVDLTHQIKLDADALLKTMGDSLNRMYEEIKRLVDEVAQRATKETQDAIAHDKKNTNLNKRNM